MRGLSKLQKAILRAALDNRAYLHSGRAVEVVGTRYSDDYYMLKWDCDLMQLNALHLTNATSKAAARVSISRAFSRLEARGLVVRKHYRRAAIKVTPAGEAMVNKSSA